MSPSYSYCYSLLSDVQARVCSWPGTYIHFVPNPELGTAGTVQDDAVSRT